MTPRSGGAEKVIAMVYKNDYQVLAATIGLDLALNPQDIRRHRDPQIHSPQ